MGFEIEYSPDALSQLEALRRFDQARVASGIETRLRHEPLVPSRHRKLMRSKIISTWELRIADFRVYYDVDESAEMVFIRAIGIKLRDRVFIGGEEADLS